MASPRIALTEPTLGQAALETAIARSNRVLEAFAAGLSIEDDTLTTPPTLTGSGDVYIVATGGSGAWSGHDGQLAIDVSATDWAFATPKAGMRARFTATGRLKAHNGTAWSDDDSANIGTAFPAGPIDGQRFYRTDLDAEFCYDSGRSKWLGSELICLEAVEPTALGANTYADLIPGVVKMTANIGWQLPWDCTVVGGHAWKADTSFVALFRLRRNGTNVTVLSFAASGDQHRQDFTLNADINATTGTTDAVGVFIQPGGVQSAAGNYCRWYLRRRAS